MRSGNGLAVLLIGFGGLIILSKVGIGFGFLMGLLIPVLIILLAIMAWKNGNKLLGGVMAVIGGIMIMGKLSFLFVWIIAIALVLFGISMLKKNGSVRV